MKITYFLLIAYLSISSLNNIDSGPKQPALKSIQYVIQNLDGGQPACDYTVTLSIEFADGLRSYWKSQTKVIDFGQTVTFTFVVDAGHSISSETAVINYYGGPNMSVADIDNYYTFDYSCQNDPNYVTQWHPDNWGLGSDYLVYQDVITN
ncbi:MAG: hypothetical protein K9G67_16085 [Bacteroidales bacterium]|nr:hypothetical protein [Bacteroidales bacterium]MCF8343750.1 hypothetical protein [Bacteroidales bacterium]MCF8352771.1 hypothetical protein [Bacteroidales bacterium]MCF8377876.1 hypothetical protein [Bacteroidales bacterium]